MSIRDELAGLLEEHRFDPEMRICACGVECGVMCDNLTYLEHLNHALRNRFAVVELPEPDSVTEPMDEYQGLAEWKTDLARIGEFDDGDGFIDTELSRLMNVSPGAMRELAAALLAAANRAEAQS